MRHLFILLLCMLALQGECQNSYVTVDCNRQYSGLTRWKDKILLIPQYGSYIYYTDSQNLQKALAKAGHQPPHLDSYKIVGDLKALTDDNFAGFEAATVSPDGFIYFTIEARPRCETCGSYIVKGRISDVTRKIVLYRALKIDRPKHVFNAGYESLAYVDSSKTLLAFYEYNDEPNKALVYEINTELKVISKKYISSPLYFRVTDVTHHNNGSLLGINYYWHGDSATIKENLKAASAQMDGKDPLKNCYAGIIELRTDGNVIHWKKRKHISFACDNWEGITTFDKGVLLIVDEHAPGKHCKLLYLPL